jgi:hypothetical protein
MVKVKAGQRVMHCGLIYGSDCEAGDVFDAGDGAASLVERGLADWAGVPVTVVPPDPVEIIATELPTAAPAEIEEKPIGQKRQGKGYKRPQEEGD